MGGSALDPLPGTSVLAQFARTGRALLALALAAGFYALVLGLITLVVVGVASALLSDPKDEKAWLRAVAGIVFCVYVLAAALPRLDRFRPPGPRLLPAEHPKLFSALADLAQRTGQRPPTEVYLTFEVNAEVSQWGGFLGLGARRVLVVGLPLLQALDVRELRSVLAHELGHFHGGDTWLAPWVYHTRDAVIRTVERLGNSRISVPFRMYAWLYLRITFALARAQEHAADRLAIALTGVASFQSALRRVEGAAAVVDPYWDSEALPTLRAGFHAPLAEGFRLFLEAPDISARVARSVDLGARVGHASPHDTHPSLKDRLAAAERLRTSAPPPPAPDVAAVPAITLLEDVPEMERRLLPWAMAQERIARLRPLRWEEHGEAVVGPRLAATAAAARAKLEIWTLADLATVIVDAKSLALAERGGAESRRSKGLAIVGAALTSALAGDGFHIESLPGRAVRLTRGECALEPFAIVEALASGSLTGDAWRAQAGAAGIADLLLAAPDPMPAA